MEIGFAHKIVAHIAGAIESGDTQISIIETFVYSEALTNVADHIYLMLRGPIYRELVKVDISASSWGNYLTVARGQGGTSARAWPLGTVLYATTHEDHFNAIIQSGENRIVDYNPNEILSPLFAGEKIYQSGPSGCERWWVSYNGTDAYWSLITGAPCSEEAYEDIGWTYEILRPGPVWEVKFADCWEQNAAQPYGVWNAGRQSWDAEAYNAIADWLSITPIGTWATDYEPDAVRVTTLYDAVSWSFTMWFGTHAVNFSGVGPNETITFGTSVQTWGWITGMRILFVLPRADRYITNIEFRIPA
jgi:hypothetical protein